MRISEYEINSAILISRVTNRVYQDMKGKNTTTLEEIIKASVNIALEIISLEIEGKQ